MSALKFIVALSAASAASAQAPIRTPEPCFKSGALRGVVQAPAPVKVPSLMEKRHFGRDWGIKDAINTHSAAVEDKVNEMWDEHKDKLPEAVQEVIEDTVDAVSDVVVKSYNDLQKSYDVTYEETKKWLEEEAKEWFEQAGEDIKEFVEGTVEDIRDYDYAGLREDAKEWFEDKHAEFKAWVASHKAKKSTEESADAAQVEADSKGCWQKTKDWVSAQWTAFMGWF